uniref:hypothetical protein n=1 Tax=Cupriavidus taiwanensis TaxID=164546 RepID=UPI0018D56899|nr:hypothetical protein [Cupriavidus taiwanensis]
MQAKAKAKAKGRVVWALPAAQQFSVDAETALLIAPIEFDPLEVYDAGIAPGQVTAGFRWYAQYGGSTGPHARRQRPMRTLLAFRKLAAEGRLAWKGPQHQNPCCDVQ